MLQWRASLNRRQPLDQPLAAYEKQRNDAVMAMYDFTYQMALLTPQPPEFRMLMAAISRSQTEITRFLGTFGGTGSIPEFFSPENTQRIVAAAQGGATAHA